jgi:hypothetical protein
MQNPLNKTQREGFLNRHTEGLPEKSVPMRVVTNDFFGEMVFLCEWKPFNRNNYSKENMPADGYLGTVKVTEEKFKGIGFHAWKTSNSEFVYYQLV